MVHVHAVRIHQVIVATLAIAEATAIDTVGVQDMTIAIPGPSQAAAYEQLHEQQGVVGGVRDAAPPWRPWWP